jgi:hypothetical protein
MNIKLKVAVVVTVSAASLLTALDYSWAQTDGNVGGEQQVRKVEEERRQAILRNDIKRSNLRQCRLGGRSCGNH